MVKTKAFLSANWNSWTVRLGALAALLVTVAAYVPQMKVVLDAVWPAASPWLVVAAMWVGRAIGFLRAIIAAGNALQGADSETETGV